MSAGQFPYALTAVVIKEGSDNGKALAVYAGELYEELVKADGEIRAKDHLIKVLRQENSFLQEKVE